MARSAHLQPFNRRKLLLNCAYLLPLYVLVWFLSNFLARLAMPSVIFGKTSTDTGVWTIRLLIDFLMSLAVVKITRDKVSGTRYALTSRRVIVVRPTLPTVPRAMFRIDEAALFRLRPRLRLNYDPEYKSGTIVFGTLPSERHANAYGVPYFSNIENAKQVYELLVKARGALPQTEAADYARSRYASRSSVPALPAFAMEEHLWGDERVLWQGAPNRRKSFKSVPGISLAVAIMLILGICPPLAIFHGSTGNTFAYIVAGLLLVSYPATWLSVNQNCQATSYYLTSRRVIVVKQHRTGFRLDEMPLQQTRSLRIARIRSGTATLGFEKSDPTRNPSANGGACYFFSFAFKSIDRWTEVLTLIREAREALECGQARGEELPYTAAALRTA